MQFGLSNNLVKILQAAIVHPIGHLVNRIIVTQIYPYKRHIATVLALLKSKVSGEDISNYRPISLLSPLSKVFEQVLHFQINQHIEKNNLWNKDNNAYRANHSTATALI